MKRALVAMAISALSMLAQAGEQNVRIAPDVNGAWVMPDGAWDGRTVLFLHGFADDMNGSGDRH